jgi:hypothetical protein
MFPVVRKPPMLPANAVEEIMSVIDRARRVGRSIFILVLLVNRAFTGLAGLARLRWPAVIFEPACIFNSLLSSTHFKGCAKEIRWIDRGVTALALQFTDIHP